MGAQYINKYTKMRHFSAQRRQVELKISQKYLTCRSNNLWYVLANLNLSNTENFKMWRGHSALRKSCLIPNDSLLVFHCACVRAHTHTTPHTSFWVVLQAQKPFANFQCCYRPFPVWSLMGNQLHRSPEIPIVHQGCSTHAFRIQGHSYK